jgi:hypothetical protein
VVFVASVTRSLKSLMVFAFACRSEGGVWVFARTTSVARPVVPAGVAFGLRNADVGVDERGVCVVAFTPTFSLRGASSTKSAGAEDCCEMVKTLPSLEMVLRGF